MVINHTTIAMPPRLRAVADSAGSGGVAADVGTDHALVPIFLTASGRFERAIASDIAEGPCAVARRAVEESGLSDRIEVRRCDGLQGYASGEAGTVIIAGMGGETIRDIIASGARFERYVLQPMTRAPELRRYLYESGFTVAEEKLARDSGRLYTIITALRGGEPRDTDELALLTGDAVRDNPRELALEYLAHLHTVLKKRADGLRRSGSADAAQTVNLLERLEKYIEDRKNI